MSGRAKQIKEDRKAEILINSYQIIFLNGYHGTGVKEITDAAGIPKGKKVPEGIFIDQSVTRQYNYLNSIKQRSCYA